MPTIVANTAVIHDGKILLTKRDDFEVWCLPSGAVEEGESVADAAIRETREETGLNVMLTRLVGVYSRLDCLPDVHAVLFAAKPVGGILRSQVGETLEVRYFALNEIPDELAFGHRQRILDAINSVEGVAWSQKMPSPLGRRITRHELCELRDQSGLSKAQFYLSFLMQTQPEAEKLQVG